MGDFEGAITPNPKQPTLPETPPAPASKATKPRGNITTGKRDQVKRPPTSTPLLTWIRRQGGIAIDESVQKLRKESSSRSKIATGGGSSGGRAAPISSSFRKWPWRTDALSRWTRMSFGQPSRTRSPAGRPSIRTPSGSTSGTTSEPAERGRPRKSGTRRQNSSSKPGSTAAKSPLTSLRTSRPWSKRALTPRLSAGSAPRISSATSSSTLSRRTGSSPRNRGVPRRHLLRRQEGPGACPGSHGREG